MKSTGIIRRIDELGRIVIPKELRKKLEINIKDPMEIFVDGHSITLKKVENNCVFCGKNKNLVVLKDKVICQNCLNELNTETKSDNK